jgi:hypothetical protein
LKRITSLVLIVLALAIGWIVATVGSAWRAGGNLVTYHTGPTIEQVRALSCLVTTRVDVADVVDTQLNGRTGGMKAVMIVKGDFLLGVDLSVAKFESVDTAAHTAVLVLPQPKVTSPRLDHERTKVFMVCQSGLWQIAPGGGQASGEVIDRGYRDSQRFVAAACNDPALIERSRRQAKQVLEAFFAAMNWKIEFQWSH